jgi:hypothetical protein
LKSATSPAKFTSEEPKKLITPPSIPIDLDLFLRSIQKMKNQFNDLDRLLGNEKDMTVLPTVKKWWIKAYYFFWYIFLRRNLMNIKIN